MNILLLDGGEVEAGEAVLAAGDRRARHLRQVLRAVPGQRIRVGIAGGATGTGELVALEPAVRLRLSLDGPASPRPPVDLIAALPRPKAVSRLVQSAAALGVGRIDLVNAWRVDRSYFDSPRVAAPSLAADARLGCEQGATTWIPPIAVHRLLVPYLAAAAWPAGAALLVAHPRGEALLEEVMAPGDRRPAVLAIGPEGGWIDRELASFAGLGFRAVRLGPAVMRADTAVAAALAQLELLRRLTPR